MHKLNKIFVGGSVMSGKNILWRLLDGHPEIISNCMHSNIGYFVLSDDCKKWFLKDRAGIGKKTLSFLPMCNIVYNSGEQVSVDIGNFFYALYKFTDYKTFYSWAKGNSMFVNMKEGENKRFPFTFNINGFEKTIEKELFVESRLFSEEELLDVIYTSYIDSLGDNNFFAKVVNHNKCFVDTLPNGINPIRMVAKKIPDAKIIVLNRNRVSLLYANAARIMSYKGSVQVDNSFKKILYNQKAFEKKISMFYNDVTNLQASNENVQFVDFNDLILDTEMAMKNLAKFIGVQYDPILSVPSINGEIINNDKYQIIGKINDDPYEFLSEDEIDLLKYLLYGYDKQYSIKKKIAIFLQHIKWRQLIIFKRIISIFLKTIFPQSVFINLKKYYNGYS